MAGHALVEALVAQGVDTCFGVPGESYLAVLDGFQDDRGRIRVIAVLHAGRAHCRAEAQGPPSRLPRPCAAPPLPARHAPTHGGGRHKAKGMG